MSALPYPYRGEVWLVDLNPVVGHEQGERRPALILSCDELNHGPSGLVTAVPITKVTGKKLARAIPFHLPIAQGEAGLPMDSILLCDQVRTLSRLRLVKPYGSVTVATMRGVEGMVSVVLGLG